MLHFLVNFFASFTRSHSWDNVTTAWPKTSSSAISAPPPHAVPKPITTRHYLLNGGMFAAYFGRSPTELGEAKICPYLLHAIEVQVDFYPCRERRICPLRRHAVTDSESLLGDGNRGGRANNGHARGIN